MYLSDGKRKVDIYESSESNNDEEYKLLLDEDKNKKGQDNVKHKGTFVYWEINFVMLTDFN